MLNNLKIIFSLSVMIFFSATSFAWHLTGGEMYYECLGNNQYEITIKVYKDTISSAAPFDNPLPLSIFDGNGQPYLINGNSNTVFVNHNNNILTTPNLNICAVNVFQVEVATYTTTLTLPFNSLGYHMSYQRCCLNQNIINIFNPSTYGMTLTTFISADAQTLYNNSPTFVNETQTTYCVGEPIHMDFSGIDIDGDSLHYTFKTPLTGFQQGNPGPGPASPPPYSNVPYISPVFTNSFPLGSNITIDSLTGILTGSITQIGLYYFGITIDEYRNGQLLSSIQKIFLIQVTACADVTANIDIELCHGDSIVFDGNTYNTTGMYQVTVPTAFGCDSLLNMNLTVLPNSDSTISAFICDGQSYNWNNNIYTTSGIHTISSIDNNGCDSITTLELSVLPTITLLDTIIVDDNGSSNGSIELFLDDTVGVFTYIWSNGAIGRKIENLTYGFYSVTITNQAGCSASFSFIVNFNTSTKIINTENYTINVFPNPLKNSELLTVQIETKTANSVYVEILNTSGQLLQSEKYQTQKGTNDLKIPLNFSNGLYFIVIKNENYKNLGKMTLLIE